MNYFWHIIGSPTQIESYAEQLNEKIPKVKEEFAKRNSEKLTYKTGVRISIL